MAAKENRHYNQTINSLEIAAKANRQDIIIKPSVLWKWQPKPIDTIIEPSIFWKWQQKPIVKTV
jgi:hypothetical protein